MIQAFAFYLFAGLLLLSGFMVITARNPVHSVLFLILGFFNAAGLFVLLGAEFIAMILIIVYVGAVAVLFLFVVMMLDINFSDLRKGAMQYVPFGFVLGAVLLGEFYVMYKAAQFAPQIATPNSGTEALSNTEMLGMVIYTDYVYAFQAAGMVLFVAMIGAIVLTLRKRPNVKKQNVGDQFARTREDSMEIRKVTPGTGV